APVHSRSSVAQLGDHSVSLSWTKIGTGPWKFKSVSGGLDWRFLSSGESDRIEITRLTAAFRTPNDASPDVWPMWIESVELSTINGPLAVSFTDDGDTLSSNAVLESGKLRITDPLKASKPGFDVEIGPFTLDRVRFDAPELVKDGPVPDWSDTGVE